MLGRLRQRVTSALRIGGLPLARPAGARSSLRRQQRLLVEPLEPRLVLSADTTVVFNEVMYNPLGTAEASLEWIELYNQMAVDMDISGWSIEGAVEFEFPEGTVVSGGQYLVVAADPDYLQAETGVTGALGPYDGLLANGGEQIDLVNNSDRLMDSVEYDDEGSWPVAPDGSGASLAKINPNSTSGPAENWIASGEVGGTPDAQNFLDPNDPTEMELGFNEVAAAGEPAFWLELVNYGNTSVQLGGYVIANSSGSQYTMPTQWIGPGELTLVTEAELSFGAALGDKLYLYTPELDRVLDGTRVENVLRGRYPDGPGPWLFPDAPTPGAANSFDLHDEIVINEIMYHDRPQLEVPFGLQETLPVEMGASWRYDQSSADLQTAWRDPDYDDDSWSFGAAAFGAGAADYNSMILADSPVSYWDFDESAVGTGTAYDQVGDNHGSFTGSAGRTTGLIGVGAAQFHGVSSDAVNVGNGGGDFSFTTGISVEAVVQPDAGLGNNRYEEVFRKEDGSNRVLLSFQEFGSILSFGLNVGGYAELDMPLDGVDGRPTLDDLKDGGAHHVVATYDSLTGEKTIWVDGTPCYSTNLGGGGLVSSGGTANAYIGSSGGSSEPFNGIIDEVAVYNYALSSEQIANHSAAGIMEADTSLVLGPTTFYFRNEFQFDGDPAATQLTLSTFVDDGAVFYLNGVEVYRQNMPGGSISYDTYAESAIELPSMNGPVVIPSDELVAGSNVLAVEVHQAVAFDDDVFFAAELEAAESLSEGQPYAESPEEWIELYNRGGTTVDLTGWTIQDAVDFEFPAGTTIAPDEYLVVARDADSLRAEYTEIEIVGDLSRRLSNGDDRIVLVDAHGNPADEVHYYEDHPWPAYADGDGSSLELRDPDADNSKAEAWAASSERLRSEWQTITYRGTAANPPGSNNPTTYNEFILGLLDAGEVLLDDITVIEDPDGDARQLIQNATFESATTDKWRIIGNHHGTVVTDPDDPGNRVLHLVATGPCEHLANHAETTLKYGTSFVPIHVGWQYEISLKVKWLAGSRQLNTRLFFNLLPKTSVLDVPEGSGTPGAQNSVFETNIGPTYSELQHSPITPAAGEAVTVSVVAEDADDVAAMSLWYSVNGGTWTSVTMTPGDEGLYTANVPGQSSGRVVQFYVSGEDDLGASSTFPAAGRDSRALLKVDDGMAGVAGLYSMRIIMTAADAALLSSSTNLMSNDRLGATVVSEGEVFYDVGVRLKGSEHGRPDLNRRGFSVKFHADDLFRGIHETIGIDRSGGWRFGTRYGQDEILIYHMFNHAGDVPSMYSDLVYVDAPGVPDGTAILQLARYNDVYLDSQFQNGADGTAFEYELIYTMVLSNPGNPESLKVASEGPSVFGVSIRSMGDEKESYRHNYLIKNNRTQDDYSRLIGLAQAFSLSGSAFYEETAELLDVDQWLRAYAAMSLIGAGDNYSTGAQHNVNFYTRPEDGKTLMFPWDMDFAFMPSLQYAPLSSNGDLNKLISLSANRRMFYGHLHDIITTTYNTAYMSDWVSHYDGLLPSQYLGSILTYIGARANHVLAQLPNEVPFVVTTNGGNDFSVDDLAVTIEGNGWINVREIRVEGYDPDPELTWIDQDTWHLTVPLDPGANLLSFQAFDFQGNPVGTDSITVTSTVVDRPLQEYLRITELNYNPAGPTEEEETAGFTSNNDFEFLELQNVGNQKLSLSGVRFSDGIDFEFTGQYEGPPILVTEAGTGHPDYVEIQNVSDHAVDTTGWVVAVNNEEAFNINDVHATLWTLPTTIAAGEVLYRDDDGSDPEHWGDGIFWTTPGNGWVMIVDDQGAVADFVVWGYGIAEIETLEVDINGFEDITLGSAWSGLAAPAGGASNPANSLQRSGNSDHDDATDWAFVSPQSVDTEDEEGIQNAGLTIPFLAAPVELDPGAFVVIACNTAAFETRYGSGIDLAGQYSGKLANDGERVILVGPAGQVILDFEYGDSNDNGWPDRADGQGSSLEVIDPQGDHNDPHNWRASIPWGGTPGEEAVEPSVVINEVLSHTDYPLADAIELHNLTEEPIDVGGWWLSDSDNDYQKFEIPSGTTLPGGGYLVFYQGHFVFDDPDWVLAFDQAVEFGGTGEKDFALSGAQGDEVFLTAYGLSDEHPAHFVDQVEFGAALSGESFGRWENSRGESYFYPMTERTLDLPAANSGPRIGPELVISEVMYNPLDPDGEGGIDPDDLEFIELFNPTAEVVALTDWRLDKGIDFDFAVGTTVDPGEALVVVRFNPVTQPGKESDFRALYAIGPSVQIVGGHSDKLDNDGERVQLQDRDEPALTGNPPELVTPHPLEDEVDYRTNWYPSANGGGDSLNRLGSGLWGDDPESWTAAPPTPGLVAMVARIDGRYVFYNNSAFDSGPGETDDEAIAPDKQALLPGAAASFANYTSYALGINGIVIDVFDLKDSAGLSATDFTFKVGNDDSPATWTSLTTMPMVDVRADEGSGGSDRVVLTWADHVIQNEWLEVTLKANGNTGLAAPDVFYFGNAIGETGDTTAHARVDSTDILHTRNNPHPFFNPAQINSNYDFNRDGRVDATDILIVRSNQTAFFDELNLIDLSGTKAFPPASRPNTAEKAAAASRTSAHDAVLERTVPREWNRPTHPRSRMDWLWQLDSVGARHRPPRSIEPAERAVDLLLATGQA